MLSLLTDIRWRWLGSFPANIPSGGSLHLIDLRTWEGQVQELQLDSYVNAMEFSPDGNQLGISHLAIRTEPCLFSICKPTLYKIKTAIRQNSLDFLHLQHEIHFRWQWTDGLWFTDRKPLHRQRNEPQASYRNPA
jgi:hypothetical protein